MRLLIFMLCISMVYGFGLNLKQCHDEEHNNMEFHVCKGLKEYSKIYFHDVTGENSVRLVNNKLYRNHGQYTSMYKNSMLYVGKAKYTDEEWFDAFHYKYD